MDASDRAKADFKMTEFQGFNVSISICQNAASPDLRVLSIVYYHAHRVCSGESPTRHVSDWSRLSLLLCWFSQLLIHWNGGNGRYNALSDWSNMVRCSRDSPPTSIQ